MNTACKVNLDEGLYARVKNKAKAEKVTVKSIVVAAFERFLAGGAPADGASPSAIVQMLDDHQAAAEIDRDAAENANDPQRAKRLRSELAFIDKLRAAHAAASETAP